MQAVQSASQQNTFVTYVLIVSYPTTSHLTRICTDKVRDGKWKAKSHARNAKSYAVANIETGSHHSAHSTIHAYIHIHTLVLYGCRK